MATTGLNVRFGSMAGKSSVGCSKNLYSPGNEVRVDCMMRSPRSRRETAGSTTERRMLLSILRSVSLRRGRAGHRGRRTTHRRQGPVRPATCYGRVRAQLAPSSRARSRSPDHPSPAGASAEARSAASPASATCMISLLKSSASAAAEFRSRSASER